ncbi:MAG: aldehyde dehydrogenase family protein [Gaiella sp.]
MSRLPVRKTYKLFIGGAFPRSESGRTLELEGSNVARGSRKDARDAVVAARKAFPVWAQATAYNRGQVLYRLAETMETRSDALAAVCEGRLEVETAIDRVVWYAGWADKLAQVLGSANPVAGPYFNFTISEPTGVVAIVAPDVPALDGLVARLAPALAGGNAVVVVASDVHPLAAIELAECVATSDLPSGVVNVLTGMRAELAPVLAAHMDVNAIDVGGAGDEATELELAAAENVKRVVRHGMQQSPWEIAAFMELKTVWHPIGV